MERILKLDTMRGRAQQRDENFSISPSPRHPVTPSIFRLDELGYACDRVRDYLQTNAEVKQEDRHLCEGVKTQPTNPK